MMANMLPDVRDDPSAEMDLPFMDQHSSIKDEEDNDLRMEEVVVGDETIDIPSDLYTDPAIFHQFFSIDTWNGLLPEEIKLGLLNLLPSFHQNDIHEKAKTIEMLFGGENFHFGNPISKFRTELLEGDFSQERRAMKSIVREAQERDHREWLGRHRIMLVQQLLDSRKVLLEEATGTQVTSPRIDTKLVGGHVRRRIRRRYLDEVTRIKREVDEIGLSSDDEECEEDQEEFLHEEHMKNVELTQDPELSQTKGFSHGVNLSPGPVLTQDLQPCYFALLRDLFLASPTHCMSMDQLQRGVATWQASPIAALNPWYQVSFKILAFFLRCILEDCPDPGGWRVVIRPAVSFLSGSASDLPRGFLPMLRPRPGGHQWVAQGRDTDSLLLSLSSWWLDQLSSNRLTLDGICSGTVSASSTQWTVKPSTLEERQQFQCQERARYSQPARPFQWTHPAGFTTLVGPVKSLGAGKHTKQHAMLVPGRPAGITILTLVRDAVSRLPNGEGTRTDIVELLKDSQYLVSDLDGGSLTTTVSGALDRLQNEPDSSVRFDNSKKIWIYLHRDRTADDFCAASQAKSDPSKPRKKKMKSVQNDNLSLDAGMVLKTLLRYLC